MKAQLLNKQFFSTEFTPFQGSEIPSFENNFYFQLIKILEVVRSFIKSTSVIFVTPSAWNQTLFIYHNYRKTHLGTYQKTFNH